MDGFPSGQRGQTVNLLAPPSKVRILLHPANLALTSLRCRSYFFVQKENRKGAAKPRPLCTPLGLFLECLTVAGGRVLTCACMLRLFRVERCADGAPWALWMCDVVGRGWRVCERRAWFAGMVVVCVTFAWNTWTRLWTLRLVCRDDCGVCLRMCGMRSILRIVKLV